MLSNNRILLFHSSVLEKIQKIFFSPTFDKLNLKANLSTLLFFEFIHESLANQDHHQGIFFLDKIKI